ncbi:uncharacterized protein LOC105201627 [Solenopsis invicta]|uniref:uncharacterized protein LOC105201627 n=1 Tax=Solenopsis invicta TaxID=13686 RepID=UPI00193D4C96|nr:uncharacterized protein LOC105201627 [Solenopsis invicta]
MDLLPVNFYVLRFCGVWKERKDDNLIIRFISFCYRYTIVALIYHFTICEVIELVRMRNNVDDLTEGLFMVLTYICLCLKYLNILMRQSELHALLNCFRIKLCQPKDSTEELILKQYHLQAKKVICAFMLISQITGLLVLTAPLMSQNKRQLPLKMYVPYSMAELLPYLLTYLQQVGAVIYGVLLNVTFDSLVYGLIIHTCGQIELLCHRLSETFRFLQENSEEKRHGAIEKFAITECVRHHISVCSITQRIQSLFMWIVATLFFFSLVTLCTSIYQMSNKKLFGVEFFAFVMYLGSMLFQVFSYCWFGNELDLKNKSIAYAIYASNWTIVSVKQRKSLLFIMMISQRGRIISFYGICSLVLSTFTWILKTSYSAFNLLQQDERQLPMKMYVPYSMVKLLPYLLTYLEQAVAIIYGISIDIVLHSLVYGFTILACGQIDLLCYRLSETFRFLQLQDNSEEKGDDTIEKFAIAECRETIYQSDGLGIMDILPYNFRVLWFCGAWSEKNNNNFFVRFLSFCYRYAVVILIYEFTISEVIELVRTRDDIEDMTEGLFMALTYVALCFKYGNFLARKEEMSMLLDCFRRETCQPRNSEEKTILIKYDRKAKWCVRTFMSISQATCIALILAPIVGPQNTDRPLPFKTYLPYSISGLYPYLATYLQHVGAIFYGVLLNVSFDSLVYGFTLHVCGQIELLCYRLSKLFKPSHYPEQYRIDSGKGAMISECVRHHLYVHEIVRRIQSLFVWTVTVLFIFSLVTLCTSIFQMSKKKILSVGFLSLILYLGSMLFQVFFYCWYGNELQLKSKSIVDAIYSSDWTVASTRDRRSLLFVMAISQKGLKLSYYGIFNLALDTFTWILKTSYSAFNVLQQTSM